VLKTIDLVREALVNILRLCHSSSKLEMGQTGLELQWGAEETRRGLCQQLEGKELVQVLLECYTGTHLRMPNSLQCTIDENSRKTPKLPVSKPRLPSQLSDSAEPASSGSRKRTNSAVPQPVNSRNSEKPCYQLPVTSGCSKQELLCAPKGHQYEINVILHVFDCSTGITIVYSLRSIPRPFRRRSNLLQRINFHCGPKDPRFASLPTAYRLQGHSVSPLLSYS